MTTPLELARELDVRVEALLSALSELGASPVDYEAPLTAEDEEYLRLRFAPFQKRSFWRSLLGRFRRRPSPEQLDRELFERALPALGAAPPLVSVPPAPAPWDVGEDLSAALAAADTLSLPRTTGERETSPPLTRDEGGHPPAVAGAEAGMESPPESLSTDVLGDIDLSALLGATDLPTAESTQPSGGPEEGDIDLSELLGVAAEPSQAAASAVESTPTPEEMLGLRFESEEGEDDFDLQALLESSVAEPEAAPASKAGSKAKDEPPAVATTPVPTTAPATASATAPLSRWQKVWVGAAAAIMLALAAFVGRYSWVYYQEHRPGGDQRLYDQGVAYLDEEAYDKAAGRLSTLIQNYPDSSLSELAFFKYGEALFGQGKYPAAISTYRRALAFQEQRVKATEAMDYPDILRRQEAQRQIARGMGLSGNYEDAVHEYRQLLELYRNDEIERELKVELAELYSRWGTARGEARPLEMAIGLYQIAAAEHPDAQETVGWYDAAGQAAMALAQLVPASAEEYQADAREALETALAAGDRLGFLPGEEAMVLSRLGRVAEALGDDARTAAAYRRLLSASPELPEEAQAYTGLAQIEMRRAEWHRQEAMRILRRLEARGTAVAVQPPAAGALGDETAVDEKSAALAAALRRLADGTGAAEVRESARAGLAELEKERSAYAAALQYADHVAEGAEKDEQKAIGFYIRGDVAWQEGRLGDMVRQYQEAMQLPANLPELEQRAHLRIINYLYVVRKDYKEALERIGEVLLRYPNDRYSYYARYLEGQCHEALGAWEKAADSYAQVVLSFPESRFADRKLLRDALYRLPAALERAGESARAVQAYISAMEKAPDDARAPAARLHLAECHRKTGDLDRAVGVYRIFLENFPDHPEVIDARLALAECYLQYYDFDSARSQLRLAASSAIGTESEAVALSRIAACYVAEAETAPATEAAALRLEAESHYRVLAQKFPRYQEAYLRLAELAEMRRDWGEAYRNLSEYVKAASEAADDPALALRRAELAGRRSQWGEVLLCLPGPVPETLAGGERARWDFYRAEALRGENRLEEAVAAYRQAQRSATPRSRLADEIDRKLRDLDYRRRVAAFSQAP